ncbi:MULTISPECIES: hypothetical protein [unclassified Streptomyces]|uniref:hypothetical protein n=1 Tax=unclassified Streptomyces TaxID=2593676 RepID=UPI0038250430
MTGRTRYATTGPALTTPRQRARDLAEVLGRYSGVLGEPVAFVERSRDEARTEMLRLMPETVAATTLAILGEPPPPSNGSAPRPNSSSAVRPAPSLTEWAGRNIGAFEQQASGQPVFS